MAGILEWSYQEFRKSVINILWPLMEKVDNMQEQMWGERLKFYERIKKKCQKWKILTEMKNAFDELSRLYSSVERITELEDMHIREGISQGKFKVFFFENR